MRSVIAAALIATQLAGCLCSMSSEGTCEPQQVHNHYYEDDDDDMVAAILVGAALVAVVAIIAAKNSGSGSSTSATNRYVPPPVAQPTYVIAAPTGDPEDERLQRMFVQGHLSARAGRCEATIAIAKHLAQVNPSYYARYAADPTIATCLPRL